MANPADLTTFADPLGRDWVSTGARFRQGVEMLDLEFEYSGGTRRAVRFQANSDVRLYGELISEGGAIRSYESFSFTVYGSPAKDIASFRNYDSSAQSVNAERLRVTSDGTVKAAAGANLMLEGEKLELRTLHAGSATFPIWGTIQFNTNSERVIDCSDASVTDGLKVKSRFFRLENYDSAGSAFAVWGTFSLTSSERLIDCSDATVTYGLRVKSPFFRLETLDNYASTYAVWGTFSIPNESSVPRSIVAQDGSSAYQVLRLDAKKVEVRTEVSSAIGTWGTLARAALVGSRLDIPDDFFWQVKDGSTYKDVLVDCRKFHINLHDEDCFNLNDEDEINRFKLTTKGQIIITSKSSQNADITLDASTTSGAKKWTLRAAAGGSPAGSLKFVNETDGGTPTVEIEAAGNLYAPGFVGCKTTTAAPSDSDGRVGAIAVDTSNKRVWVKVTDSGSNRWWYAALVSP